MGAVEALRSVEPTEEMVRNQLKALIEDQAFRSSRRSIAFLRYVVEQTLQGSAEHLKERTIGIEVFERDPLYETSEDHVVRTAATELRKRLAIYYGNEKHRSELHILLRPGSYVPQFTLPRPDLEVPATQEPTPRKNWKAYVQFSLVALVLLGVTIILASRLHGESPRSQFWYPVLHSGAPVLIAVGDVPDGPPVISVKQAAEDVPPLPRPGASNPPTVPFGDAVTIARVTSVLAESGKQVVIRREGASSFDDLREGPVVLIGAFNNTWSLRLTRSLRFNLAMDPARHLIYIRDREHPNSRKWSWNVGVHLSAGNVVSDLPLHDYALISRIVDSSTGHVVVIIGGLYVYGTEAAGEFLSNPKLMSQANRLPLRDDKRNLQIVLETDVTQQTPGPPRIVAYSGN